MCFGFVTASPKFLNVRSKLPSKREPQLRFRVKEWIEEISGHGFLDLKLPLRIRVLVLDTRARGLVYRNKVLAQLLAWDEGSLP